MKLIISTFIFGIVFFALGYGLGSNRQETKSANRQEASLTLPRNSNQNPPEEMQFRVQLDKLYSNGKFDSATIAQGKLLLEKWIKEGDAIEILNWCRTRNFPFHSGFMSGMIFKRLANEHPERVREQLRAMGSRHYLSDAARGIMDCQWSSEEKQQFFLSFHPGGADFASLNLSLECEVNPEAAAALASRAASPEDRRRLLRAVLVEWSTKAPKQSLAWVSENLSDGFFKNAIIAQVISNALSDNPIEAVAALKQIPEGLPKNQAITKIFGQWSRVDLPAALAYLEAMPAGSARNAAVSAVAMSLPASATNTANQLLKVASSKSQQTVIVREASNRMAAENPQMAIQWAQTLSAPDLKDTALRFTYQTWAAKKPADAAAYLVDNWSAEESKANFGLVFPRLAQANSQAALELLGRLPQTDQAEAAKSILEFSGQFFSDKDLDRLHSIKSNSHNTISR